MARLIRLVPAKRISLHRLQDLFKTCSLPEESKNWIDKIAEEKPGKPHYKELLKTIASEQRDAPKQAVTYGSIMTRLRMEHKIIFDNAEEIKELCKSLSSMVPEYVTARELSVDLTTNPETVLSSISSYTQEYPEEEQKGLIF